MCTFNAFQSIEACFYTFHIKAIHSALELTSANARTLSSLLLLLVLPGRKGVGLSNSMVERPLTLEGEATRSASGRVRSSHDSITEGLKDMASISGEPWFSIEVTELDLPLVGVVFRGKGCDSAVELSMFLSLNRVRQAVHTLTFPGMGGCRELPRTVLLVQELQNILPHIRQWWRLTKIPNLISHSEHWWQSLSGIQWLSVDVTRSAGL